MNNTDQVVIINGASGGLGPAVVSGFADAGAKVVLTGHNLAGVQQTMADLGLTDAQARAVAADLTTPDGAAAVVEQTTAAFGVPDVVVHVTGGFAAGETVAEMEVSTWTRMIALNMHSAFHTAHAVLPGMLERGSGKLIFISTRTAVQPAAKLAAYGASKAGLEHLVHTLAEETRQHGINVNAIAPSVIDTATNRKFNPNADYARWVTPESLTDVIMFLASDAARDVHGAIIPVYGRS